MYILTQFLSNRSQNVMVDSCYRRVRSAAGQCFGPVIVSPVQLRAFSHFGV